MPSRRSNTKSKGPDLSKLADRLILRHLRLSVPDSSWRQELQEGRRPEERMEQNVRCIAIVGAGASAPLFRRGTELADKLEKEHAADREARQAEKFRLERVYGLDPDAFETRLAALSRTPEVTEVVRHAIAQNYNYRHPTILGYELLAHLLKHRFLDAIISFNFDELLDQSLDDELGVGEYRRLVSDRDAVAVIRDPDDADYKPLYIKLHGTAADPGSLRFTREAYYQLPPQLASVVQDLFESDLCVIVNVGSAMTGFDMHRLLRIPRELEIHDLSLLPISETVQGQISGERLHPLKDSLPLEDEDPRPPALFAIPKEKEKDCNGWMLALAREIASRSGARAEPNTLARLVTFRSVERHEAVSDVLAPDQLKSWIRDPVKNRSAYVRYLQRRTILELALSGAKARGLAQLSWLAVDRCGKYYELYRQEARGLPKAVYTWSDLRSNAGLVESGPLPDVVQSRPSLCTPETPVTEAEFTLREFIPEALAAQIAPHLGNLSSEAKRRLAGTIADLQAGSEVEIQPTDDRVCAKAFNNPLTLPTVTSLRTFTLGLFRDTVPEDKVYMICESGEWLLEDDEMRTALLRHQNIQVITAFDLKLRALYDAFGERLTLSTIDPWRHNRHMTIVCRGGDPRRAVYFARRLRTPLITPVYLRDADDARRMKRAFDLMYDQAGGDDALLLGPGIPPPGEELAA